MGNRGASKKKRGEARPLKSSPQTVNGCRTGYFLARYVDLDGRTRQAGRFKLKGDANAAALKRVNELNSQYRTPGGELTFIEWHEIWPKRSRRDQRTISTNKHRIDKYILPHLPDEGDIPTTNLTRDMLYDVQIDLLEAGYAKGTIDGAFSSLSAVLGYAIKEDRLEVNVAHGIRVDPDDPLLNPINEDRPRRYIPPEEFARFFKHVKPRHRAVCLAPVATGCRTQELLALERADRDKEQQLVFVHQRAKILGGPADDESALRPGLKTTKGVRRKTKEERGRWTLFPTIVTAVAPARMHRRLIFSSPQGCVWGQRNFYRDVWEPASEKAKTNFTIYDLRHTFISHLLASGIPTVEVAAYAGHSTRQLGDIDNTTTRIYQHPTGAYREAALAAIGEYIPAGMYV